MIRVVAGFLLAPLIAWLVHLTLLAFIHDKEISALVRQSGHSAWYLTVWSFPLLFAAAILLPLLFLSLCQFKVKLHFLFFLFAGVLTVCLFVILPVGFGHSSTPLSSVGGFLHYLFPQCVAVVSAFVGFWGIAVYNNPGLSDPTRHASS